MSNILFHFDDLPKGNAANAVKRAFRQYGVVPVVVEPISAIKRANGVSYRELVLSWSDSQQVRMRLQKSGEILQVLLNGKPLTISAPDDHARAIREITTALDTKRAAFQAAMTRRQKKLPASLATSVPKQIADLTQRRDDLITIRDGLRDTLAELTAQAA